VASHHLNFIRFHPSEMIFFFSNGFRESNQWNGRLNGTGTTDRDPVIRRHTHGTTGQRPKLIEATASILFQGRTRPGIEPFDELFALILRPLVNEAIRIQLWRGGGKHGDLPRCSPFDPLPLLIWKRSKTSLNFLSVENRHGKQADTTVGAALGTGESAEKGGVRAMKPLSSLFKQRSRPQGVALLA
jgi:hypothetical protein